MLLHSAQFGLYLNVLDYDEPQGGATYGQRNRLLTSLHLTDRGRHWETIGTLFYTDELRKLLDWLTDLLIQRDTTTQLLFRESGVCIEWEDGDPETDLFLFRFTLPPQIAPPWWTSDDASPYALTMTCTQDVIQAAVVELTLQIRAFPGR